MANTTISPNMNLPIPTVSQDPGPDWATNNNACLTAIDSHNHTPGQGVPITPSGMDISSDLAIGDNNLTTVRTVNFSAQGSPLALPADLGCIYVSGVDLYYNDENGNQVRITQSGSVTGSSGTITGLPSGTASASYSAGTFTFQGATNTPATMAVGPLVVGAAVANAKTCTIAPPSGLAADYAFTLPSGLPAANKGIIVSDTSGNLTYIVARTFSGTLTAAASSVVISSGSYTSLVGLTGTSSVSGLTTAKYPITGDNSNSVTVQQLGSSANGDIKIINKDGANSNVYNITVFYIA